MAKQHKVQEKDASILIDELEVDLQRVRRLHGAIVASTDSHTCNSEETKEELQQLLSTIKTASCVIRGSIRDLEQAVSENAKEGDGELNRILTAKLKRGESQFTVDEAEQLIQEGNVDVLTQGINEECEHLRHIFAEMAVDPKGPDLIKMEKCWKVLERHQIMIDKANAKLGIKNNNCRGRFNQDSVSRERIQSCIYESRINMLKSQEKVYQSQVLTRTSKRDFCSIIERIPLGIRIFCVICINLTLIFLIIVFLKWTQTVSSSPWFESKSK